MLVCLLTEIDGPGIYLKTVKLNFLGLTRLCFESSARLMTKEYSSWILLGSLGRSMNAKLVSGFHRLLNVTCESAINLIGLFWKLLGFARVCSTENIIN